MYRLRSYTCLLSKWNQFITDQNMYARSESTLEYVQYQLSYIFSHISKILVNVVNKLIITWSIAVMVILARIYFEFWRIQQEFFSSITKPNYTMHSRKCSIDKKHKCHMYEHKCHMYEHKCHMYEHKCHSNNISHVNWI